MTVARTAAPRPGVAGRVRAIGRHRWAWLFISPFFVAFALFYLYPYAFAFALPFTTWNGAQPMTPAGTANFEALFKDPRFLGSIVNTGIMWLLYGPVTVMLATVVAAMVNSPYARRLRGLYLIMLILPNVTSMVAAAYTFKLLLDPSAGYVNGLLATIGTGPVPWLTDVFWARVSVSILVLWGGLGFTTILMLAGLQNVSPEVIEAAKVDGCSAPGAFLRITLPLLKPVIIFCLITSLIGVIELFTEPYILTGGGPMAATETPANRIFEAIFSQSRYGYAATMAMALFVLLVPLALAQFWHSSRDEDR